MKRIAITGGAGNIAYSALFRLASGELFGKNEPIALHILEIPEALKALEGIQMELNDCAFPLLQEVVIGSDPYQVFADVDVAFLIGAKPRGPGMERSDLLQDNGKIFVKQGDALNAVANRDVKVLVVGNPCNTNCLIAMHHAPDIPRTNFHAMTRLDQNRAKFQLAHQAGVPVEAVTEMTIWGNHSTTQVPDFMHAKINGKLVPEVIQDRQWLIESFIPKVQKRGGEIIAARGKSSAASAANAAIDAMRALFVKTPEGESFSSGVSSNGNGYGVPEDLIFSFPCRSSGDGSYAIVPNIDWDPFLSEKIQASAKELMEERDLVRDLLTQKVK